MSFDLAAVATVGSGKGGRWWPAGPGRAGCEPEPGGLTREGLGRQRSAQDEVVRAAEEATSRASLQAQPARSASAATS